MTQTPKTWKLDDRIHGSEGWKTCVDTGQEGIRELKKTSGGEEEEEAQEDNDEELNHEESLACCASASRANDPALDWTDFQFAILHLCRQNEENN